MSISPDDTRPNPADEVAVVIIGRNEGERLKKCVRSCESQFSLAVYIDSGSTDGSVDWIRSNGHIAIELDEDKPFSAARSRNVGILHVMSNQPTVEYVQVVDGDCELADQWLHEARAEMEKDDQVSIVCGRRRERFPDASLYNKLCDIEWDTPVGSANACGGDALIRLKAFKQVGGFDESFSAGEEPELCFRLRNEGWKIHRIAAEMTIHDAAMTSVWQWWQRSKRSGSAYAQTMLKHGSSSERMAVRDSMRIWLWGGVIPLLTIVSFFIAGKWCIAFLSLYLILGFRVFRQGRRIGLRQKYAAVYSVAMILIKFPQLIGQLDFFLRGHSRLVEYK